MFPCIVKEIEIEGTRKKKKERKTNGWKCSKIARKGATEHQNKPVLYSVQYQARQEAQEAWEKSSQSEWNEHLLSAT